MLGTASTLRPLVWVLMGLVLLAVAERRVAEYSHQSSSEARVENRDAPKGDAIIQALLAIDTANVPAVAGITPCSFQERPDDETAASVAVNSAPCRSPPAPARIVGSI